MMQNISVTGSLLNFVDGLEEAEVVFIKWVYLEFSQEFPPHDGRADVDSFWLYEILPEVAHSLDLAFQQRNVVEVLALVELLELVVDCLCLSHVRFDGKILLVLFSDVVFEFLLYLQLCQSSLKPEGLSFHEFGQIIGYFLVGVKIEDIFGAIETHFQLLQQFFVSWD